MAKTISTWALIGLVAIFAGCGTQPTGERFMMQPMPKDCPDNQGRCEIKVGVAKCSAVPNACDLYVDYDIVRFGRGRNGPIRWDLQEPGYVFPDDGITFVAACAPSIRNCRPVANGRAFQCENMHAQEAYCKYTVKITGPTNTNPLDPWVVND